MSTSPVGLSQSQARVAWFVPMVTAGGIGPVSIETATALAALNRAEVTLIETHASPRSDTVEPSGVRRVALDMAGTDASAQIVLDWLDRNPQDVIFSNGVSHLQATFPYIPEDTLHVAVLHDAARRYRADVLSYARYLDGVIAVSHYVYEAIRDDLRQTGFSGLLRRIHNGSGFPQEAARTALAGPLKLLFIGNMWLKGGAKLVDIGKALRRCGVDFRLTIVADEAPWVRRRLVSAGLHEKVVWLPRRPRGDLWKIYAAHDLLLMLSWGEPFGMVTIEAMSMGCVPVAYDVPSGSRDIIEPGISGILVAPHHAAVAAAVAGLTPARLVSMAAEASRRARTQFSAQRAAQAYGDLIGDLLRCRSLIHRSRLSPHEAAPAAETPSRPALVRLYSALPPSWRGRIRNALAAYPTGAKWLRERF